MKRWFGTALFKSADLTHFDQMPTADDFKAKGNEAFAKEEFLKAAKLYRDAIALDPTNPVLFSNRAQCFINVADWTRAYRDTEAGLLLNPTDKIKGKLLFRRGISTKELGHTDVALESFEQVIQLDPSNGSAQEELRLLMGSAKSKRAKSTNEVQIPLEIVSKLPPPFDSIVYSGIIAADADADADADANTDADVDVDVGIGRSLESRVNLAIEELFGTRTIPDKSDSTMTDSLKFNDFPSMHFLKSLANVPPEKKLGAYKLVTDLDDTTLKDMFLVTGVDSEFFDFYVESAAFALNNGDKSAAQIFSTLQLFQSLPRFSIVVSMCPLSQISGLLAVAEEKLPHYLNSFRNILA